MEHFEEIKSEFRAWWRWENRYPLVYAPAQYANLSDCIPPTLKNLEDLYLDADALLKIPRLHGIQWQKGVNGGPTLSWLPLLKKIQKAGKLVFVDGSPEDITQLCAELEPQGLLVATACKSIEESRELIRRIRQRF